MPLSEYEQRVLEQMERALESDDPRLATTLQRSRRRSPLRFVLAGIGVVLGLLLLVVGVATQQTWLGVVGFALMFAGVATAFAAPRSRGPQGTVRPDGSVAPHGHTSAPHRPAKAKSSGGFMNRLEERWDKRRQQDR
ncbi:Protein of unknown function (DUF3040) [Isoptericola jiangsuensis]|uniref:DUF3040 family protein n=1 Tax=Isoptericola jiangsuensis TaxID=548579 RepID=A0A2A9EVC4_9MICO|nr:DUF3040 domain-containing protein [Isoptericola jiangsuensis]PFG42838.1 Protein of unknown function (DUF3040) [Isoptericola jiangsuensis]